MKRKKPKATHAEDLEFARRRAPVWRDDPVTWAQERLGVTVTDDQAAVLRDIAAHALVSWRSGQKCGKTETIGVAALWWADTRKAALVVITSGNRQQVKAQIWRALRRLHKGALIPLGGTLNVDPATGLVFPDGRLVIGITAAEAEKIAGYSGAELLELCDESSGLDDEIIEAVLGNLAGGGHAMLCGNPTKPTGTFARTHRECLTGWRLHHTSARAVAASGKAPAGMATAAWIADMEATFGEDSAAVAVRVDGEYPKEGHDSVIGVALVEAAKMRWSPEAQGFGDLEVGCDVGRYGDDPSCIVARRGDHTFAPKQVRKQDGPTVAAAALAYVETLRRPGERVTIRVDAIGVGASVYDALVRTAPTGVTVVAIQSSETSRHPDRFKNQRSELWWCVRRWLERGGTLQPGDDKRDAELLVARYSTDHAHRIIVASKDEMKRKLRRSPDFADALALACFGESPTDDESAHGEPHRPHPHFTIRRSFDGPAPTTDYKGDPIARRAPMHNFEIKKRYL